MSFLQILIPWMSSHQECKETEAVKEIPVSCELIRSSRKTMAIQVTEDGQIRIRVPYRITEEEAAHFAIQHRSWIGRQYQKAIEEAKARPIYSAEEIHHYKEVFRPVLQHRAAYYAKQMGVSYARIFIRDQKTRWGSCSSQGNLNFNWRLALLPETLQDYVIVHELAHRLEMNHSARFWTQVENILPDYRERRASLRKYRI